jgi:hypothetical protein
MRISISRLIDNGIHRVAHRLMGTTDLENKKPPFLVVFNR